MQTDLFTPHETENNRESQNHLNENIAHFSEQLQTVYSALINGTVLTVSTAMNVYSILSLPRRILDLKQKGFKISDRWSATYKTKIKEYYMDEDDIKFNKTHYSTYEQRQPS